MEIFEFIVSYLIPIAFVVAIVYLIFKRITEKKEEDFEERKN